MEERRNRQDLIEVFKICKGFSRISGDLVVLVVALLLRPL